MPNCLILPAHLLYSDNKMFVRPDRFYWNVKVTLRTLGVFIPSREINCKRYCRYLPEKSFIDIFGSSREFVGKSAWDTSEPVVSQAAIRHNRSRWSLLFRLPFDSRQNLMWIRLLPVRKEKWLFSSEPLNKNSAWRNILLQTMYYEEPCAWKLYSTPVWISNAFALESQNLTKRKIPS